MNTVAKCRVYISVLLLLISIACIGQSNYYYNLNSYNGLPSDHVYCIFKDRLGYLWIGTDNGVIKYNGYYATTYNISNGLVDADVWDFYEDKKGRIWLSRISEELGYFYNGEYHKVHVDKSSVHTIYPRYIREHNKGIMFVSIDGGMIYLCKEENDTLYVEKLAKWQLTSDAGITTNGKILFWTSDILSEVIRKKDGSVILIEKCTDSKYAQRVLLGNFLMPKEAPQLNRIYALNVDSCKELELGFDRNDQIYNQYQDGAKNYIITNRKIYILDKKMEEKASYLLADYFPEIERANDRVVYVIEDTFWKRCITTKKSGMYLSFEMSYFNTGSSTDLIKFRSVGKGTDNVNYWWSNESNTLKYSCNTAKYKRKKYPNIGSVDKIVPYTSTSLLVFSSKNIYFLNKKTMELTLFSNGINYYSYKDVIDPTLSHATDISNRPEYKIGAILCGLYDKKGELHCITRGYGYVYFKRSNDSLFCYRINAGRFNDILYDSLKNTFVLYNGNAMLIHTRDTIYNIDNEILEEHDISKVEKIVFNKNGTILIKDYDKIVWCDIYNKRFKTLFKGQKLKNSVIHLDDNTIIIAGKFGVQFSKVDFDDLTSQNVLYPNIKGLAYTHVYDVVTNGGVVKLNTDSGLISMPFPTDSFYSKRIENRLQYRFVLKYQKKYRAIKSSDTIFVNQHDRSLHFEIINPTGLGKVTYRSLIEKVDTAWNVWSANDIHLSNMKVDKYYSIHVKAIDDVWESPDMSLVIYIVPTFWQTTTGIGLIWSIISIASIVIIMLVVYFTRKIVSKAHIQKNLLLSLKLKSVYAQINPHFIFNTLNTGLYFIKENKTNEAYTHISSFSELLRSYIKSSRNNYITLSEEIKSLEQYITLQLYRFEDMFDYQLVVGGNIKTDDVFVPSMLLQPLVENAINHGLTHKGEKGYLTIKFISNNPENEITCIVDDDGIGRERSAEINNNNPCKTDSYGSEIISDLIKLINTDNQMNVSIEYIDKSDPYTGTTVLVTIKKRHHDTKL